MEQPPPNGRGALRSSRILLLSWALAAILIGGVLGGCGNRGTEDVLRGMTRNPPSDAGGIYLPDHSGKANGQAIALRPSGEDLMLVYFGYTSCPDVCPTTLADLRQALDELSPEQRNRVTVGMVTVDPDRDTGRVLDEYLGHFFPTGSYHAFRTADRQLLHRAEAAFGASHRIGKPDPEGNYDVDHTAQVYAVGANGKVAVEWPFGTSGEDIAHDLTVLLDQTPGSGQPVQEEAQQTEKPDQQ